MRAAHFFVLAALGACATNPSSVKSSAGKDITPKAVGNTAAEMAAKLPIVKGGPALGKRSAKLEPVTIVDGPAQPVGIAVSKAGRIFISYPRWADPVKNTVVEQRGGSFSPFPDVETNAFDATKPKDFDPTAHLVSVQAMLFDERDRLWLLDPGSFNFAPSILGGPKLWAYDIESKQRVKAISFPHDVAMKMTALNDLRIDLKRGPEGTVYITDSGVGGIIVVDIATGASWRHLDDHPSVLPKPGLQTSTEGAPFQQRHESGEIDAPDFRSDGIALSPDGKTLYYDSVISHEIYGVPTDLLADKNADEAKVRAAVKTIATKPSGNDGMTTDDRGRIYTTDFEDNSIRRIDPATGIIEIVVQDERLIWPDGLAFHGSDLYVMVNQLARQPNYHHGKDERQPPYVLFKIRIND